jgi:hypothetical protein
MISFPPLFVLIAYDPLLPIIPVKAKILLLHATVLISRIALDIVVLNKYLL